MGHIRAIVGLILALALGASACSELTVQHPVGEPVPDETGSKLEGWWNATWNRQSPGGYLYVKYLTDGVIRVAGMEWEEAEKKFRLHELHGLLTRHEDTLYLHLQPLKGKQDATPEYLWLRVELHGSRSIVLWMPRLSAFEEAVKRGELAGEIKRDDGRITATKPELEAFLKDHTAAELFLLEEPLALVRP